MHEACNRNRVGQQFRNLPQAPGIIDSSEVPGIQERIPICEIDQRLIHLFTWVLKLREEPPRAQVMVVLIRFPQRIANKHMVLVVRRPVLLGAVYGDTAVGAGVLYVLWCVGLAMLWVWTVRCALNDCSTLTHGRGG